MVFLYLITRPVKLAAMPTTFEIVIADTSCFILLHKIQELNILRELFKRVYTTSEVVREFNQPLPDWVIISRATDQKYQNLLMREVDLGEASAIALSFEIEDALLILDDRQARLLAERLGKKYTGTLGLIARAAREEVVPSIEDIITRIRQTNFRFSESIFEEIRKAAKKST